MHPIAAFCEAGLRPEAVVLNIALYNKLSSDLTTDVQSLMRVSREASGLFQQYGEEVFAKILKDSGRGTIENGYLHLTPPMQQAHVIVVKQQTDLPSAKEFKDQLPSLIDIKLIGQLELIYLRTEADSDLLINLLQQKGHTHISKDRESPRDALVRYAQLNGVSKEEIEARRLQFNQTAQQFAKLPRGKLDGYEKTTDEFKKESGYDMVRVEPVEIMEEIKAIWKEGKEQMVEMQKCSIFVEKQDKIWQDETAPIKKYSK